MKKDEDNIQQEMFMWYNNNYCLKHHNPKHIIFSVPNGAFVSKPQAMKLKATGLVAGVSDLIICKPNEIIFCEVKTDTGTQSSKQKDFQKTIEDLGFKYVIVRNLEEFKNKIV